MGRKDREGMQEPWCLLMWRPQKAAWSQPLWSTAPWGCPRCSFRVCASHTFKSGLNWENNLKTFTPPWTLNLWNAFPCLHVGRIAVCLCFWFLYCVPDRPLAELVRSAVRFSMPTLLPTLAAKTSLRVAIYPGPTSCVHVQFISPIHTAC